MKKDTKRGARMSDHKGGSADAKELTRQAGAPFPPQPFLTRSYGDVKRLHAAGILARNTYGSPLIFEYAPEDRGRIEAVLGKDVT